MQAASKTIKEIKFSIIIPVFNVENYLEEAIESVLNQETSDWELILVDDGSTDRSGEICDHYALSNQRIRVLHKPNGGLVSARQTGASVCKGEYILNLDGDDYWDQHLLLNLEHIIDHAHPDGILFSLREVTENGEIIRDYHHFVPEGIYSGPELKEIWDRMLYDPRNPELNDNMGLFYHGVVLAAFRREIVVPIQMAVPKQIRLGEDAAVTIPAICKCQSVYFLERVEYNYRIRNTSISRTFFPSEILETTQLIQHLKCQAEHLSHMNRCGYLYRLMEDYWVRAARNLDNYTQFRKCVTDSLRAVDALSENVFQCMSHCQLKLKYKLRLFVVKHDMWHLFWIVYHRRKN